jgi:hypothetical protein
MGTFSWVFMSFCSNHEIRASAVEPPISLVLNIFLFVYSEIYVFTKALLDNILSNNI